MYGIGIFVFLCNNDVTFFFFSVCGAVQKPFTYLFYLVSALSRLRNRTRCRDFVPTSRAASHFLCDRRRPGPGGYQQTGDTRATSGRLDRRTCLACTSRPPVATLNLGIEHDTKPGIGMGIWIQRGFWRHRNTKRTETFSRGSKFRPDRRSDRFVTERDYVTFG